MRLAGVDGCPSGWVAVVAHVQALDQASVHFVETGTLPTFLAQFSIDFAAVDVPIGFSSGPMSRDVEAAMRAFLVGKGSSVFNTPSRPALGASSQAEASAINRATLTEVKRAGVSAQTYGIFPKMREMDGVVRQVGQGVIREGHPEVTFAEMNGKPVLTSKKAAAGIAERIALLIARGFDADRLAQTKRKLQAKPDDIIDAVAMLWTASRFVESKHETYPPVPSRDAVGLEMSVIA